jgi:threonyl-tRNA synthetase
MDEIEIEFPDKSKKKFKKGVTGAQIAKNVGERLYKAALAVEVNGRETDLNAPINENAKVNILTFESEKGKRILWHSASHLMAKAVKRVYPDAVVTIGPSIEEGFYYDFDVQSPFTESDLKKIEDELEKVIKEKNVFEKKEMDKKEAIELFKKNSYKQELINDLLENEPVSVYSIPEFMDLCKGPHIPDSAKIGAVKILKISGAYWRADSKNKMLQRVYGIAFPEKKMLEKWVKQREEAEKRNHVKLGKELELFSLQKEAPGTAFFHPNGTIVLNEMMQFVRKELFKRNYVEVMGPIILHKSLWLKSGHWDHYKENMYFTKIDEDDYAVKPMNCPGHLLIYNSKRHSYKDLPMRMAEFGIVHRHELSGVLNGLFRVRKFTQDDAHVFCTEEQLNEEIVKLIELVEEIYSAFGFKEYEVELSTRPQKSLGSDEIWEKSTNALEETLKQKKAVYKINEGQGAFYGPKIDFHIKDSLGRRWQLGTIQVDFSMPMRFELKYIGKDDKEHQPIMIHRAILGSLERFFGILIEHYAGAFPLWLSPRQVMVIPVSEKHVAHAEKVNEELRKNFIRSELNSKNDTVGYKIREAQLAKINYSMVVGDKEIEKNEVNVRDRKGEQKTMKLTEFITIVKTEIEEKKI